MSRSYGRLGINLDEVLAGDCCIPSCDRKPIEGSPMPMCFHHLSEAYAFVSDMVVSMKAKLHSDEHAAQVTAHVKMLLADQEKDRDARRRHREVVSVVYYVAMNGGVKIGYTSDIVKRVEQFRLTLDDVLAIEPGGPNLEARRHHQFATTRRGRKEEFDWSTELRAHIDEVRAEQGAPTVESLMALPRAGYLTPKAS